MSPLSVDPVHLSHPTGRDEYLFSEVGKLYGGSHNSIKGRPWIFGQFRDSILPAVCHVMDKGRDTNKLQGDTGEQ